ncbi:hypothetical protein XP1511_10455 [Xanthomonas perforans]|uniref:Uncharacterized protein n=1 Tax=Xanthomonas perforans TaxID=442694 RepID=A0AAQ0YNK6_XANPE|nr:hypothetical protein XP1511_10455 [Xanthomonas perforans]PWH23640.1 hypothetical protein CDO09_11220 [Xanthomonas perforans]RXD36428.1 hypothetical protein DB854_09250 [Xanthomonas perforans]RXD44258.1 hypothetical protein DB761_10875 [Xanthomonas perforans]RXD53143.1 hypothetical protein DB755_21440 [Xanthomonas perforans]
MANASLPHGRARLPARAPSPSPAVSATRFLGRWRGNPWQSGWGAGHCAIPSAGSADGGGSAV